MAEREGFEPSVPILSEHTISNRAPSASSDISPHSADTDPLLESLVSDRLRLSSTGTALPAINRRIVFSYLRFSLDLRLNLILSLASSLLSLPFPLLRIPKNPDCRYNIVL